ncbi:MAG: D-Ala-D-Ala carboxypeptidase family metallohydrolase [Bacteroidota bacterium]|nr:D-Ala-D-Ala carboxypeptidase family metallohydrolase [Bacteroidota bacterium]MDP4193976.1 D-Ala-D-Ala carboxypeptidase family metallohydrolase [Bacteroidota bacterium]
MSEHFSEEELSHSEYAIRHDLWNKPDKESLENLERLAEQVLEPIRKEITRPIYITSGYRTKEINSSVGGSPNSQHMKGQAVDTVCPGVPLLQYYNRIKRMVALNELIVDQVIFEFGNWVHISYISSHNRNEFLIATKRSGQTVYMSDSILPENP